MRLFFFYIRATLRNEHNACLIVSGNFAFNIYQFAYFTQTYV